jgi:hypothetical protein
MFKFAGRQHFCNSGRHLPVFFHHLNLFTLKPAYFPPEIAAFIGLPGIDPHKQGDC